MLFSLVKLVFEYGGLGGGGAKRFAELCVPLKKILAAPLTNIYVFKLLKNRGHAICQKRHVSPIL